MQLGEAEALGMFHHHDGGFGHVDADFDYRGGDQNLQFTRLEASHRRVALRRFHPAVDQADHGAQCGPQFLGAIFGSGEVDFFGFLDQRAHPIGARTLGDGGAQPLHHIVEAFGREHARFHRLASGRAAMQTRHIHVAISGEGQRARDRGRRHHQHIGDTLGLQRHALVHTEAMLLVDHHQAEILERHVVGEEGVGADQNVDFTRGQRGQQSFARCTFLAAGEQRHLDASRLRERFEGRDMLARQDFGRRHQGPLGARFHRTQQRQECHDGFSRPDIALQQSQHAGR